MKIKFFGVLVLSMLFTQCAQKEQNQNTIKCEIDGLAEGDLVVFSLGAFNQAQERIDSVLCEGGKSHFTFKTRGKDTGATIAIVPAGEAFDVKNQNRIYFFLEGYATLNIEADAGKMKYAEISGGIYDLPEMEKIKELTAKVVDKEKEVMHLIEEMQREDADKEFNNSLMKQADDILKEAHNIQTSEIGALQREFVKNNPDVAYSAALLYNDTYFKENSIPSEFKQVFMKLSDRVRKTRIGKTLYEYVLGRELTQQGAKAPAISLKTVEGKAVNLKDFQGKHTLLCFWETWQDYALFALPKRDVELNEKVSDGKLVVFSIVADEQGRYDFKTPKQKEGWLCALSADRKISRIYGVQRYPVFFLLDGNGKIVTKGELTVETLAEIKGELLN